MTFRDNLLIVAGSLPGMWNAAAGSGASGVRSGFGQAPQSGGLTARNARFLPGRFTACRRPAEDADRGRL